MAHFYQELRARRPWLLGVVLLLFTTAPPFFAQVVILTPSCGVPGAKVCIGGNSWAEPNPLCRYIFSLDPPNPPNLNADGTILAPAQQDGVYGPPSTSFTVPSVANGGHTVQVRLVLDDGPSTPVQVATKPFTVTASIANPYTPPPGNVYNGVPVFLATFDPNGVCDASPCSNIRFIQVLQLTGRLAADHTKTRIMTGAEINLPYAATFDKDTTPAGWTADLNSSATSPYYQWPRPGGVVSGGTSPNVPATMGDAPNIGTFPADVDEAIVNFLDAVICVEGDLKGTYLGTLSWTLTQTVPGGARTVTLGVPNRNQPSQVLMDAVVKWNANHVYTAKFPTPNVQPCIY